MGAFRDQREINRLKATRDEFDALRAASLGALASIKDPASLPVLLRQLDAGAYGSEAYVSSILAITGKQEIPQFSHRLDIASPRFVEQVRSSPWLIDQFGNLLLNSDDSDGRRRTLDAFGKLNDRRAVDYLIAALAKECFGDVIDVLKEQRDPRRFDTLARALKDRTRCEGERSRIIEAMEGLKDSRVPNAFLAAMSDPEECDDNLIWALSRQGGPRVFEALAQAFKDRKGCEGGRSTIITAIANIKDPRVPDLLLMAMASPDLDTLTAAINGLAKYKSGDIRTRADSILVERIKNEYFKSQGFASAVRQYGWEPANQRQRVYSWISLEDKESLNKNFPAVTVVLVDDIVQGGMERTQYAVDTFVRLGRSGVIPTLVETLNRRGTKTMALVYLNCGHEELEVAAENWAIRNGYIVHRTPGSSGTARWGAWSG